MCVIKHEDVHKNHVDCIDCTLNRPNFKGSVHPLRGESEAYKESVRCYEDSLSSCGTDQWCLDTLNELIKNSIDNGNNVNKAITTGAKYPCF